MFDLLLVRDFLELSVCDAIVAEMRERAAAHAPVYGTSAGAAVLPQMRSTKCIEVPPRIRELVMQRFLAQMPVLARHFGIGLESCEEPQFLRYEAGDFFVAHQDGNLALLRDDSRFRKVSIVVFLSRGHDGGALTFHGAWPDHEVRHAVEGEPGSLLAFRSETTHEVTPVTSGERFTIVSWYRSGA